MIDCLNKFVPTKLTCKRRNLPLLDKSLRKVIRKKARLYNRAKTLKRPDLWEKYKLQKRDTQRNLRRARWSFINDKFLTSLEIQNSKPFWRYIKSQRQDRCGVSPLLHDSQLHSDSGRKAEILNQQFCSVFTDEDTTNISKLEGPPITDMDKIEITESGITKLLSELNADKAAGPDELPNLLLKNAAKEISPFLKDIFEHSIQTGKSPDEWVEANVAPVLKKRDRHTASNCRPISLTCVCAKLLEDIICKSIMTSFTKNEMLTPVQHGFRA